MLLKEAINKLLRDTINLVLSSPDFAIAAKQKDAIRPKGQYASVDFVTDTSIGIEQHSLQDNTQDVDIMDTIQGMREIMMSLSFYRDNAGDNARYTRIRLVRESVQELFSTAGIGLVSRSAVRDISQPLENGWEEGAQFDVVLSAVGSDTDIIRSIRSVNIDSEYQSPGVKFNNSIGVS